MQSEAERRLQNITQALSTFQPERYEDRASGASFNGTSAAGTVRASVALVVRPEAADLAILLIRRAAVAGDPWSGHMALPGGKRSPGDSSLRDTAMREALEEVGIDLQQHGIYLGRLDDVRPGSGAPRVVVSPFVFAVPEGTMTTINHEVDLTVWVPLRHLAGPGAATHYLHALGSGETLRFPAIGYLEHVVWGLTYRIVSQFLEIARAAGAGGAQ